jgi:hypothetical protein
MLARFNMTNAASAKILLDSLLSLLKVKAEDKRCNIKEYQKFMKSLNYLAVYSCFDIVYAVFLLS